MGIYLSDSFLVHLDTDFFRDSVLFTAAQTDLRPVLVEKDYYCSLLLAYLFQHDEIPIVFKGGTSLSKIYTNFYRLSEDLDFIISMPINASRSKRRGKIAPLKELIGNITANIPGLNVISQLKGHNISYQYIGIIAYSSVVSISSEPSKIKIEIGLREELLCPPDIRKTKTLLINPFSLEAAVPEFEVKTLTLKEAYSEKLRAALTRRIPAVRDFFDIDYALCNLGLNLEDNDLSNMVIAKLKVPGNFPIDISESKKRELKNQLDTQLKPVLRAHDYNTFNLDKVFVVISKFGLKIEKLMLDNV